MLGSDVEGAVADVNSSRSNRDSAGPHDEPTREYLDQRSCDDGPYEFRFKTRLASDGDHHDKGGEPSDGNNPEEGLWNAKFCTVHTAKLLMDQILEGGVELIEGVFKAQILPLLRGTVGAHEGNLGHFAEY